MRREPHPSFPPGMRYRPRACGWHARSDGSHARGESSSDEQPLCGGGGRSPTLVADPVVSCSRCLQLMRRRQR